MNVLTTHYKATLSPRTGKGAFVAGVPSFYRARNWRFPGRRTFVKSYGSPACEASKPMLPTIITKRATPPATAAETVANLHKSYLPQHAH